MGPRYAVLGCLTLDSVITHDRRRYASVAGGNSLYTALGARVWSESVGIVSRAGTDYPRATLTALSDLGVDVSGIILHDGRHEFTVAFEYTADGHRSRTVSPELLAGLPEEERRYFFDNTADEALRLKYAPGLSQIPDSWIRETRGWHLATIPLVTQRSLALGLRKSCSVGTVLVADAVDAKDIAVGAELADFAYVSSLDALLPSEVELGVPGLDEPLERISAFHALGVNAVAMKFGPRGSVVRTAAGTWHVPCVPVDAVDPTGAGDAYCGGFLVGYAETGDAVEAAIFGTVAASYTVESPGPQLRTSVLRAEAEARADAVRRRVRDVGHDDSGFGEPNY